MRKGITTIKISKGLVEELSELKIHPRQAYEEVIVKLLGFYKKDDILRNKSKEERLFRKKGITTIKISKEVVEELSELKIHPRQAYEEVIVKLLSFYEENFLKKGKK